VRTPLALAAVLLAGACSTTPTATDAPPASVPPVPATTTASAPAAAGPEPCGLVAQEDLRVTDTLIDKGCADDTGSVRLGKVTPCTDGRRLWELDNLIGFSGELIWERETKVEGGVPVWSLYYRTCKG
jgi:hypothetical protein